MSLSATVCQLTCLSAGTLTRIITGCHSTVSPWQHFFYPSALFMVEQSTRKYPHRCCKSTSWWTIKLQLCVFSRVIAFSDFSFIILLFGCASALRVTKKSLQCLTTQLMTTRQLYIQGSPCDAVISCKRATEWILRCDYDLKHKLNT